MGQFLTLERNGPMNPELEGIQGQLQRVYNEHRIRVSTFTTPNLEELLHRSEEIRFNPSHKYLLRVSAEINRAAATLELEKRNEQKPIRPTSIDSSGGS
jgi:hypothetical protein